MTKAFPEQKSTCGKLLALDRSFIAIEFSCVKQKILTFGTNRTKEPMNGLNCTTQFIWTVTTLGGLKEMIK